jgi:uncharacterized protein DUF4112
MDRADAGTVGRVERLRRLARLLDAAVRIPGIGARVGLDGIVGLVPGIGDAATAALSLYIVLEARRLGVRKGALARMLANVAIDTLVGAVPVLGDVFDVVWKANLRNIGIIEEHMAGGKEARR